MLIEQAVQQVVYPDQSKMLVWDGVPYKTTVKDLEYSLIYARGQYKQDVQETLDYIKEQYRLRMEAITT